MDALNDPHLEARGYFVDADHPKAGRLPYTGASLFVDGGGFELKHTAPLLGEHNEEVYSGRLGMTKLEIGQLRSAGVV